MSEQCIYRSLGQGNVFTGVCHSVHNGICMMSLPVWLLGPMFLLGGFSLTDTPLDRDPPRERPPWTETHQTEPLLRKRARGTYLTGMHLCDIYRPQWSWAKLMFLWVSVILLTGGVCHSACWDTQTPPHPHTPTPPWADTPSQEQTPPGTDIPPHLPPEQTPLRSRHPPGVDTVPGSRLQYTVNERPVHILLECILVLFRSLELIDYRYLFHFRNHPL